MARKFEIKDDGKVIDEKHRQNVSFTKKKKTPAIEKEELNLDKQHKDYDSLYPNWQVLSDCFDGGGAIEKAENDVYLIKKQNEKDKKYERRQRQAVYYNKPAQIISTFQGHLWRKEPERELPKELEIYQDNVDRNGKSMNKFFSYVTKYTQVFGLYYVLVEYPENPDFKNVDKQSINDEKKLGLRPYFNLISPVNVLDWGWKTNLDGSRSLAYVVIKEAKNIFNVPFLDREDQIQYRVIYPDKYEIWVYQKVSEKRQVAVKVDEKPISLGEIPLVPFYSEEIKYGVGKSAIYDIVNLALEHYNKHSDRNHAEVRSAFPLLFLKGFVNDGKLTISEEFGIINEDINCDGKYIEFSGSSIEALRQAERDIINEIFDLAMKQVRSTSNQRETAESKRMDRLDALSDLQARAVSFSNSEKRCWEYAAKWLKINPNRIEDIKVAYNLDFDIDQIESELIGKLIDLRNIGDLSQETLWKVLNRGEVLPRDFDPEDEKLKIEQEAMTKVLPFQTPEVKSEEEEEEEETEE